MRAAALQREVDALLAVAAVGDLGWPLLDLLLRKASRNETHHCAVQPPSIERLAPVIEAAASEVR